MTERLYDSQPQLDTFTARVLSCEEADGHWLIGLDRTAFFPEGGGQPADHGSLGGVRVTDVHEKGGVILHTADGPLTPGTAVEGAIDRARRTEMSQQHTGEHIFSGLTCARHHCSNVGFHIGPEVTTLDFSAALTPADVDALEEAANAAIWRDLPVKCWYPDPETLARLPYRSKKALEGPVRIVEIGGVDICACCGTHMPTTGGVGQVKIIGLMNYKGGVRLTMVCGVRALRWANALLQENRAAQRLLSARAGELPESVQRLMAERDGLRGRLNEIGEALFRAAAEAEAGESVRVVTAEFLPPASLRHAAGELARGAELALVLIPDEGGCQFALSSAVRDVRPLARALCEAFSGKGGGPRDMAQGRLAVLDAPACRRLLQGSL